MFYYKLDSNPYLSRSTSLLPGADIDNGIRGYTSIASLKGLFYPCLISEPLPSTLDIYLLGPFGDIKGKFWKDLLEVRFGSTEAVFRLHKSKEKMEPSEKFSSSDIGHLE